MLSNAELDHYNSTGQVTPAYKLAPEMVDDIKVRMGQLFDDHPELDSDYAPSLIEYDLGWLNYGADTGILDCVAQIMGDDIIVWGSALFCKKAIGGKPTPWHQDGQYWPIRPLEACTVWIALDKSTRENGCLRVIPGSHKRKEIFKHEFEREGEQILNQRVNAVSMLNAEPVDIVLEPGMISLHDAFIIHGAEPNKSGLRRGGLTFRYMPTTSHYDRRLAAVLGEKQGGLPLEKRNLHLVRGVDRCGLNDVF